MTRLSFQIPKQDKKRLLVPGGQTILIKIMRNLSYLITVGLMAASLCGCKTQTQESSNAPQKDRQSLYVPLVSKLSGASAFSGSMPVNMAKLYIEVLDDRDVKDQIGQNVEDDAKPIKIVADQGDSPVVFVQKIITQQMKDMGVTLVDNAASAERVMTIKLTHFWVQESSLYRGSVNLAVEMKDSEKTIWRSVASGENKRFGRSLSKDNYREVLSDATLDALKKLLGDPGFRTAISK